MASQPFSGVIWAIYAVSLFTMIDTITNIIKDCPNGILLDLEVGGEGCSSITCGYLHSQLVK